MGARVFLRTVAVLCLAGFSLALWSSAASAGECPNEERREEQNATYLPDCRAYEMVSPLDKNGADIQSSGNGSRLSMTGDRATFVARAGFGETRGSGSFGNVQYVASRDPSAGWGALRAVTPQTVPTAQQLVIGAVGVHVFSDSLDKGLVEAYDLAESTNDLPNNTNYYEEDTATGALEALTTPIGVEPFSFELLLAFGESGMRGQSSDLGVVTFGGFADLMTGLPSGQKLYEWNHGKLEMAGVLPNGSFPTGGADGPTEGESSSSVSHDGSRVVFRSPTDGSKPAQLYLRRSSSTTAWVSQSESSTPNPEPHNVRFDAMSADGTKVLFTSSDALTDSDPGGAGVGLYLYTDGPNPEAEQNLTFIARLQNYPSEFATQLVAAVSEDAKRVYFFTGKTATLNEGLYLWDEGALHFVAAIHKPLGKGRAPESLTKSLAQASASGAQLAFLSPEQLTAAPLGVKSNKERLPAMYVYDEASETLRCISCLPSGDPTTSFVTVQPEAVFVFGALDLYTPERFMSPGGRYVFFSTADALVASDVNKVADAYEYNVETGAISLLSSGTSKDGTWFADSSPDGSNVLVVSRQSYLRQDTDSLVDLYDVRVDGGFPQPAPSIGGCVGDECQGVPSAAPTFNTSSGFSGLGNVAHRASGKPKAKGLTRAQKLARALKACKRKRGKARRRCEAQARKRYGAKKASKSNSRAARR